MSPIMIEKTLIAVHSLINIDSYNISFSKKAKRVFSLAIAQFEGMPNALKISEAIFAVNLSSHTLGINVKAQTIARRQIQ
jgi:hypothetical protein